MYRIYSRLESGLKIPHSTTRTTNPDEARKAFEYAIGRANADPRHVVSVLNYGDRILATHDSNSPIGSKDNWTGYVDDINWPGTKPLNMPKVQSVYLDETTINHARILGGGNLSLGLRRAVKMATGA